MKAQRNQAGFASWELALGVLAVAVIAFAGYKVYSSQQPAGNSTNTTASTGNSSVTVPSAPTISSAADLDRATAVLDQVDPSGSSTSDSTQLSSQMNF